jgi:hypothetical protein
LPNMPALPATKASPPELPLRNGIHVSTAVGLAERANVGKMLPPELPSKSYANATAGPSRSRLGEGQGRPAFSPAPPSLPSRENIHNIRGRLAAWTSAAGSSSSFSRSESSSTLSSSAPSAFTQAQQRLPSSAQKVLGQAGSAVQKGWAGLRARGVGGSISSISGVSGKRDGSEPGSSWGNGVSRKSSRDHSLSAAMQERGDGPFFAEGVVLRPGGEKTGRVFGRDITEAGRAWGVVGAGSTIDGESEWERRRRACLPALVVRAVAYRECSKRESGRY